ncbi:hypothetical protein Tco_1309998, partial [Tanacetum coccineum]
RKAHLLKDKQIPSVGVFDEVFSTWMAFGGNTRDLGSFGEETDKIMDLHQIPWRFMHTLRGDGVAGIKRHHRDIYGDGVRNFTTASGRGRLKEDLESSTWQRRGQDNTFDDDVDEAPVQDLAHNVDNVFQADQCDAFDTVVDEAPTAQTMFMANLSSADPIYDEAGLSYDSDILFEVQDHDNYIDSVGEYHKVHEMQHDIQQNYVVDSDTKYTSDSNIIPYEQYVKDNVVQVVQSNVSSVPNYSLMMIINYMHEQATQCVSANEQNKVVNEPLTAELARYKEQVVIYEKKAGFELTKREQKIDEQMRIIINDRKIKEETLKRELHSVKMQLNSTIDHNKFSLLYNGHEIVKTNHAPTVVLDSEETLEIAEITRKKMLKKMKSLMWIEEVKEMKEIFEQMKAEVEQNVEDKRCADIERKNLLIENENLIADCLSNELLYSVIDAVNTVSRFFEIHDAYTVEQARCLELEAEISKLKHKIQNKDHINSSTKASWSKPRSNTKNNRILPAKRDNKKKVEDHPRNNKSNLKQKNHVDSSISSKRIVINSNSNSMCKTCYKCLISANHDKCVVKYLKSVHAPPVKNVMSKVKQVWKTTGNLFANVGYQWKPTKRKFTLGEQCHLTRFNKSKVVPLKQHENVSTSETVITERLSYGDYVIGDSMISRVYYVEGLRHNLFFVGQICDLDLEVIFKKHLCYVRDVDGVELLKGSHGTNL